MRPHKLAKARRVLAYHAEGLVDRADDAANEPIVPYPARIQRVNLAVIDVGIAAVEKPILWRAQRDGFLLGPDARALRREALEEALAH